MTDSPATPPMKPVAPASSTASAPKKRRQPAHTTDQAAPDNLLEKDVNYQPQWDRLTRLMVTVFLIVFFIFILFVVGPLLQTLIVALILSFLMYFPARWLTRRTLFSWAGSVVLCYFLLVSSAIFGVGALIPPAADSIDSAGRGIQRLYTDFQNSLREYEEEDGIISVFGAPIDLNPVIEPVRNFILGNITPQTPPKEAGFPVDSETESPVSAQPATQGFDIQSILQQVSSMFGIVTSAVTSALGTVTGFITGLLFAVFISFLIMLDLPRFNRSLGDWVPGIYQREAALIFEKLEHIWTGFFRGQVIIGITIGLITFIQLTLMGLPSALVLSIVVALISLIPTIGGFIALVPLFFAPLFQGSTAFPEMSNFTFALLVVGANLVITQIIWNVVAPKILGDALNLPVVVIIVGVFIGAAVGGVLGAFLVAPIMSTLWLIVNYLVRKIAQKDPFPGEHPKSVLGAAQFTTSDVSEDDDLMAAANEADAQDMTPL
ncbi:MAG: hypothetical protein UZ15_CFX003001590 [Chloroflexi bacterium OLB15]|nr:MAG: hypothetical protein UZ15_CFX003001590 [Chloroflexi bacterium OLB15]